MNSRTRLRRLVLINWCGVFYQPFDLAQGVTALEGPNGAGKTTVMVALFVALLPDQRLLSFRNVGESGGEGDRGIYGRLGRQGPSYTLIEFETPQGESAWAGVLLMRGADPKLELTPFLIEGLDPGIPPQDVLLSLRDEQEWVPTLPELKEQVAIHGGVLRTQDSVGSYLGALYERGILPLPLATHDERERFHRVLATSMLGGLSAFIQKGLRDYLFAEDTQLRSHVGRMRENLEACRITRRQIAEARNRYETIRGVFEAGWGMVAAAFHGTRLRANLLRDGLAGGVKALREQRQALAHAEEAYRQALAQHESCKTELNEREQVRTQALAFLQRAEAAYRLAGEIERLAADERESGALRAVAGKAQDACQQERDAAYQAFDAAQTQREDSALALSSAQDAFEQLYRRVAELRTARKTLADVRAALPDREVTTDSAQALSSECEAKWSDALNAKAAATQALAEYEARKARFDAAHAALERLAETPIVPAEAGRAVRQWDEIFRSRKAEVEAAKDLPLRIQAAQEQARLQEAVHKASAELGVTDSASFRTALSDAQANESELRAKEDDLQQALSLHRQTITRCEGRIPTLEEHAAAWELAQTLASALAFHCPAGFAREQDVAALEKTLRRQLQEAVEAQRLHQKEARRLSDEANSLNFAGGRLPEDLVTLADQVGGRLLAEAFDDVPEEEAAKVEARLGVLAGAIVVDDPYAAAHIAAEAADRPDSVWLIAPEGIPEQTTGETYGDSELVESAALVRLTRRPNHPVVGRAAREREIARLRKQAEHERGLAEECARQVTTLTTAHDEAARLVPLARWLFVPTPKGELDRVIREQREAAGAIEQLERQRTDVVGELTAASRRVKALTRLAPEARLLDPPDWRKEYLHLTEKLREVNETRAWLDRHLDDWNAVQNNFLDLQNRPDAAQFARLEGEVRAAETELKSWQRARELLSELCSRLPAFAHADAEALLEKEQGVLSDLRARHREVEAAVQRAKGRWEAAEKGLQEAREEYTRRDAAYQTSKAKGATRRSELADIGLAGTAEERALAETQAGTAKTEFEVAEKAERAADKAADRAVLEVENRGKREREAVDTVRRQLKDARPNWWHWIQLKGEARAQGVLERLMALDLRRRYDHQDASPVNAFEAASECAGELRSALGHAEGGGDVLTRIEPWLAAREEGGRGLQNLRAWAEVRRYLEQRIPRDIAQAAEPEVALVQIHEHLTILANRLEDQELALRQRTEDVANSIASRIRREEQRLGQINRGLAQVQFGSIRGVKLNLARIPTFQALIDAMRGHDDLFSTDAPLEEAMAQLFEQVGGGRVRGEQLLDYREYVKLSVQVKRLGHDAWAEARPGSLSTGESIGVGASILIVILDAWEHHAALLRGRRTVGSLRFLFLDEATRLDANALDTLTDFCERMHVQLLAAAPGLDRARRGHVYSMVRMENEGMEEVLVRGRRWA